ncbi:hypothetical protein QVD17_30255 [Tagetes erecta]|uniref:Transmembrane protein n=1 Tax=Tagetes erecta TaxID=13708 RepID=A0AAD8K2D6_TARER|nr:hypothetical protein QVD17_30255 [Tagetes erecta]
MCYMNDFYMIPLLSSHFLHLHTLLLLPHLRRNPPAIRRSPVGSPTNLSPFPLLYLYQFQKPKQKTTIYKKKSKKFLGFLLFIQINLLFVLYISSDSDLSITRGEGSYKSTKKS